MSDTEGQVWLSKEEAGQRIMALRDMLGLTQEALGVALGYAEGSSAQSTLDQAEKGTRRLPVVRLVRLCRLAGVPVTTFMHPDVVKAAPPEPRGEKLIVARHLERYAAELRREAISDDAAGPPGGHPLGPDGREGVEEAS